MTLSGWDLFIYAGAVFILFLTPGPVWIALTARTLTGGFRAAWPLTLGVVVGDMLWPVIAILGVSWMASFAAQMAIVLKGVAVLVFFMLGITTIRNANKTLVADSRLTRPGFAAGFLAGLLVILSNPKAVLFYMGILPGFFDLKSVTSWDIAAIVVVSQLVPLLGNLGLAAMVHRVRGFLSSPHALRNTNLAAGTLMILVGLIIPFT